MPSEIIQNYFNDKSVSKEARTKVLNDLKSGKVDESTLEKVISKKYGTKYGASSNLPQPKPLSEVQQQNNAQMGGAVAKTALDIFNPANLGKNLIGLAKSGRQIAGAINENIKGTPEKSNVVAGSGGDGSKNLVGLGSKLLNKINVSKEEIAKNIKDNPAPKRSSGLQELMKKKTGSRDLGQSLRDAFKPLREGLENTSSEQFLNDNPYLKPAAAIANSDQGKFIANVGANATASVPEGIGNTIKTLADTLEIAPNKKIEAETGQRKGLLQQFGDAAQNIGKSVGKPAREMSEEATGEGRDSLSTNVGNILGTVAASVPSMLAGGNVANATTGAVKNLNLPKWGKDLLGIMAGGAVGTEGTVAASEGRLATPEELATGGAIDLATFGASKFFGKLKDAVFKSTVPSTITEKGRDFMKKLNIGDAVSDTGISFSKKQLFNKIEKKSKTLGEKLLAEIKKAQPQLKGKTFKIDEFVDNIPNKIFSDATLRNKLKATPVEIPKIKEAVDEVVTGYKELYKGKDLSLRDLQSLKVDLGNALEESYKKAADATIRSKPLAEMELRSNLRKEIETYVPKVGEINKKLAPLLEASTRLKKKGNYSGYLTDMLAGGFYAGSYEEALNDPVKYAQNFVMGVLLKKAAMSTGSKTIFGTSLNKAGKIMASPAFVQALKTAMPKKKSN